MTADVSPPDRDDASGGRAEVSGAGSHVMARLARALADSRDGVVGERAGAAVVAARLAAARRTAAARAAGARVDASSGEVDTRPASAAGDVHADGVGNATVAGDDIGATGESNGTDDGADTGTSARGDGPAAVQVIEGGDERATTDASAALGDDGRDEDQAAGGGPTEERTDPEGPGLEVDGADTDVTDEDQRDVPEDPASSESASARSASSDDAAPAPAPAPDPEIAGGVTAGDGAWRRPSTSAGGTGRHVDRTSTAAVAREPDGRARSTVPVVAATDRSGGAPTRDGARTEGAQRRDHPANQVRARREVRLSPLAFVVLALVVALLGGVVGGVVTAAATGAFGPSSASPSQQPWESGTLDDDSAEIAAAVAAASPSVVSLRVVTPGRSEVGSGIVLGEQGRVLTNAHVVTLDGTVDDATITATTADGRVFHAWTVGIDVLADLAVVQLDGAAGLVPATFADSATLAVGQRVVALGSPLGLVGTATSGIVSTVHRSIDVASAAVPPSSDANADDQAAAERVHLAVFQTDADINPGNSGGPVVDAAGRVVGVSVAIATTTRDPDSGPAAEGSIGLGFAIPANIAVRIAEQLTQGQLPSHGALGATLRSADRLSTLDPWITGAYLEAVADQGAAQRGGLRAGDVVTGVDGVPVATAGDLLALVRSHAGGDEVEVAYVRDGETRRTTVTLDSSAD
ncbi:PDZ domain-containing protein [Pseudoclavibacter chungangensis]|uniref:PDZ domain-containing protein n=1 Tax=Pseudoclavibacter chungangensis TaxID=587635 RepID=A0A7J5BPM8_9MICO|nr:trypsin-like peptidase domain-containing protein [Pseudoclavibacter chungangensis]KAB1655091.1 PDZ domain-containing protein [Pseudoclavibacter chungangensis]NYJ66140.1 putative serine protease PepD [Pseudoclavibacter chungangensis]